MPYTADRTPLEQALARAKDDYPTGAEEIEYARRIQLWQNHEDPCPAHIKHDGIKARNELVRRNYRLAARLVWKMKARWVAAGMNFDDAFAHAVIGMTRAAEKTNVDGAYRYTTYASIWIRQAICRGCMAEHGLVKIPNHIHLAIAHYEKGEELKSAFEESAVAAALATRRMVRIDAMSTEDGHQWDVPAPDPAPASDYHLLKQIYDAVDPEHHGHLDMLANGLQPPRGVLALLRGQLQHLKQELVAA